MLYCILHCSWELHGCKVHCLWVDGGGGGDGGCHKPHVGTLLKRRNLAVWVFAKMFTVWFYMLYPMCRADPLCITHIVHERSLFSVHKCCWKRERGGGSHNPAEEACSLTVSHTGLPQLFTVQTYWSEQIRFSVLFISQMRKTFLWLELVSKGLPLILSFSERQKGANILKYPQT